MLDVKSVSFWMMLTQSKTELGLTIVVIDNHD